MKIGGTLISSLEFPGNISLVIFTGGCPLRCPYCHNPELIKGGEEINIEKIFKDIDESLDFLDSIVITGGEPLSQSNDVKKILKYAKSKKLKTKVDTNGFAPEKLRELIEFIDYVGLDIKCPFDSYEKITNVKIGKNVEKSMRIVFYSPNTFLECKTTYVPGLISFEDIKQISLEIMCDLYTLQQFRNKVVLDPKLKNNRIPLPQELRKMAESIKPDLKKVKIQTVEFGGEII